MSEVTLPEGWSQSLLGNIAEAISYGYTASSVIEDVGPKMLRITDIQDNNVNWATVPYCKIDDKKKENYLINTGDLVFARTGATVGKSFLIKGNIPESVYASYLIRVRCNEKIQVKYLSHFFNAPTYWNQITDFSSGIGQPNVNGTKLKGLLIPIPPLAEQKIIAEKLDTLLAQVDSTKTRLEKIPQILKCFRQAVLAAAVSGKLTEEWRNKQEKFNSFGKNIKSLEHFRNINLPNLPENWKWLRFDKIAEIASNLKSPLDYPTAIHIAPNHIEPWSGQASGYKSVAEDGVTSAKHEFYKGQIIYSKIRPYLCKVIIATFSGLCSADMYPINSHINKNYLLRWMSSSTFTEWASNAESRSVLPKINQKDLSKIPVPTPPLEEQTEIVRRVEQLFAYADAIEKQGQNALIRVNNLTQSILAKAFRGELTEQWRADNPELISGENSAEALLAKIKAERESAAPKKASRAKR